jgi:hypothetical protein
MSTAPSLAAGGVFTADVGTDLVFLGTPTITIMNISYAFPVAINATGYSSSAFWVPTAQANLGGSGLTWQNANDYQLNLINVNASRINGGNTVTYPSSGVLAGWLGTITIYYL